MPCYMIDPGHAPKRLGNAEILRRIAQKPGHWEIVYPDKDELTHVKMRITVKCLDCGTVREIGLASWISPNNIHRGCPNCKRVNRNAKLS